MPYLSENHKDDNISGKAPQAKMPVKLDLGQLFNKPKEKEIKEIKPVEKPNDDDNLIGEFQKIEKKIFVIDHLGKDTVEQTRADQRKQVDQQIIQSIFKSRGEQKNKKELKKKAKIEIREKQG